MNTQRLAVLGAAALTRCALASTQQTPTVAPRASLAEGVRIEVATVFDGPVCLTVRPVYVHCFSSFSERVAWALAAQRGPFTAPHSALVIERVWLEDDRPIAVALPARAPAVIVPQRVRVRWTMQHFSADGRSLGRVTHEDAGAALHFGVEAPNRAMASAIEALVDHVLRERRNALP